MVCLGARNTIKIKFGWSGEISIEIGTKSNWGKIYQDFSVDLLIVYHRENPGPNVLTSKLNSLFNVYNTNNLLWLTAISKIIYPSL